MVGLKASAIVQRNRIRNANVTLFVTGHIFFVLLFAAAAPVLAEDADPAPGIRNFHPVNDHIYRGAQPTAEGFTSLSKLGVKMVIDLRRGSEHDQYEKGLVEHAGMRYVHFPLDGFEAPSDDQITKLLALLDDSSGWPVFVHCERGADRTGTVIACYRISHDHWVNQKALEEAELHGMSWTEVLMKRYVLSYRPPPPAKQAAAAATVSAH
jgi:protein tyrosine/serine phosphatase